MRLFNEPAGREFLASEGVAKSLIEQLPLLGISGICNLVAAIKTAKHFEMGPRDVVFTCLTDSMQLYGSRLEEERPAAGHTTARRPPARSAAISKRSAPTTCAS